jgi:hypothetical protein
MLPLLLAATLLRLGQSQHNVVKADAPFDAAALTWSGTANARIRVSGKWITPLVDPDITDRHATAITHFPPAQTLEYEFDAPVGEVTVTLFSPSPSAQPRVAGPIVTRVDWSCPDGEAAPLWPPAYTIVTHAVVHHTAGSNDLVDWAAEVRNIWYFHTFSNGWGDIGYNFLIDPNGVIYEGRAGGAGAIGAHFSCRNTNTVGIALLGTFSNVPPTAAALASLEKVLADLCRLNAIDPTALLYHPPSQLVLPTILGHRDGNASAQTCTRTECPGDVLYSMLPMIRSDVAAILSAPPPPRRRVVRPNG